MKQIILKFLPVFFLLQFLFFSVSPFYGYSLEIEVIEDAGFKKIHDAVKTQDIRFIRQLIEEKHVDVNTRTETKQYTSLHIASSIYPSLRVVRLLVGYGADKEAKTEDGHTPLLLASASCRIKIVQFLLSKNANIKAKNNIQWTALHLASINNCLLVASYLLSQDSSLLHAKDDKGKTPYDLAISPTMQNFLRHSEI